jgi:hypothetical protein
MLPTAAIEHRLPGRLRLKVPSRRGDVRFFESVVRALSAHDAVEELKANPLTGGIIIRHSGPAEPILAAAAEHGVFEVKIREPARIDDPPASPEAKARDVLDALAAGLAGLAAVQLPSRPTASAVENFWNAFGAHRKLKHPGVAAMFVILGTIQLVRGELLGSASSLFFYALMARKIAAETSTTADQAAVPAPGAAP